MNSIKTTLQATNWSKQNQNSFASRSGVSSAELTRQCLKAKAIIVYSISSKRRANLAFEFYQDLSFGVR